MLGLTSLPVYTIKRIEQVMLHQLTIQLLSER